MYPTTNDSHAKPSSTLHIGKRGFVLLLSMLLSIILSAPTALAAKEPWSQLTALDHTTISRKLTRQTGDGYDYYIYEGQDFPTGLLCSTSRDFDGDQQQEYLTVSVESGNSVYLTIYEKNSSNAWEASAKVKLFESEFNSCTEAHDIFLKQSADGKLTIFNENWYHEYCIGDGAMWNFQAYQYDGSALNAIANLDIDGTDLSGNLENWHSDSYYLNYRPELDEYASVLTGFGFDITQVYWDQMICEQDENLDVLARVYSWYSTSIETITKFVGSRGQQLSCFFTTAIDCTLTDYRIPEEARISTPVEAVEDTSDTEASTTTGNYLIPDSDSRLLTEAELSQYDKDTLALIRNEILARHGYPFIKQVYRTYFEEQDWYVRNENFTYNSLNSIEMENVELIKKMENQ